MNWPGLPPGWTPPGTVPVGYDPLTEHRMQIKALEERADKHGEEIDATRADIKKVTDQLDAAKRYLLSITMSGIGLLAHWQNDPLAKTAAGILEKLAAILNK